MWDFMHMIFIGIGRDVAGGTIHLLFTSNYFSQALPFRKTLAGTALG